MDEVHYAPGWPGITPRWTSSAKQGVGTAIEAASRVWFTMSHGILNEVYHPRVDQACIRDLGLIVTDGASFFSEERRDTSSRVEWLSPGVPGFVLTNSCRRGRYRITKHVLADPRRDVVLQRIWFEAAPSAGQLPLRVFVLLAPHLANEGAGNTAWVGTYKGTPMLFAQRQGVALALAATPNIGERSVGFVGVSDGWQDLRVHSRLTRLYDRAENGNVALTGELVVAEDGKAVIALGFGTTPEEAGFHVRASLSEGFAKARTEFERSWTGWHRQFGIGQTLSPVRAAQTAVSAAVIRAHEEKGLPGGIIASLSIPWGNTKGDNDLGGYHLVWPRDLVEAAGALVAIGAHSDARRVLDYLRTTQGADGSWPQNMWLDGRPYWHGVQLDETAFPIVLVDLLRRRGGLAGDQALDYWPMVRAAACFLVQNGPATEQDRWEEDAGLSPFTLAVSVAALLIAADAADEAGEPTVATYLRETADAWNDEIDQGTFASNTGLAARLGVEGYYVRIAPSVKDGRARVDGMVAIKNHANAGDAIPARDLISPDALALVRFGLRAPDDPRILSTVRVIDSLLKIELPQGPGWRRYNDDGYGEHADGKAFDGSGIGRVWPLLIGERAHYELAAGRVAEAERLLDVFAACAGDGGLLPEQIWDAPDVPAHELFTGRPAGSAMPLVWAHAEFVKLVRSMQEGAVFDRPDVAWRRYGVERVQARHACWRFDHKLQRVAKGRNLRVETREAFRLYFTSDDWATSQRCESRDTGVGMHVADVSVAGWPGARWIEFTIEWQTPPRWEGQNFRVEVAED